MLSSNGFPPLLGYNPLILHVSLVSKDHSLYIFISMLIYVPQPFGNVVKRLGICDVIHQHDAHCPPVVASGDGVESLLASRVPYLQLDLLPSKFNGFDLEIDPNG